VEPPSRERCQLTHVYVVVSRDFVAGNDDLSTVVCAPVYRELLGLKTEIVIGPDEGVPRHSSIRCDFLTLMFKKKLATFVATLAADKQAELKQALTHALQLDR
jgi:mRNA interferase MazF